MMISFSAFEGAIEECFWLSTIINEQWDEDHKAVVRQPEWQLILTDIIS